MNCRAPNTAQGSCYQNNLSLLHVCRKAHKLVSRECNERDRRRVGGLGCVFGYTRQTLPFPDKL
jgi:hypothetical protein